MDAMSRRPVSTPGYAVVQSARHQFLVCKSCDATPAHRRPGPAMIRALRAALADAGLADSFEVTGTACMGGCDKPCSVALRAPRKAYWLFCNLDPDTDLPDIISFARLYATLSDGWCNSVDRPGKLASDIVARLPALIPSPGTPA